MTAAALDRLATVTRTRERARIAARIDEIAAVWSANNENDYSVQLHAYAEELRTEGVAIKLPTAEQVAQTNAREAEIVDAIVAEEEAGDGLPEVHHRDDFAEGTAMVSNMAARRLQNHGSITD